ncbi:hypothetical protein RRF57_013132 [Xylaria bambusicola]|uniref:Uncharacterized protein n=1 Tax=Xylaria bambusicola TaxID=326684 RepID=A0AAN7V1C2_9PEZI
MPLFNIFLQQVQHELEPTSPPLPSFRIQNTAIERPAYDAKEVAAPLPDTIVPIPGGQAHQAALVCI